MSLFNHFFGKKSKNQNHDAMKQTKEVQNEQESYSPSSQGNKPPIKQPSVPKTEIPTAETASSSLPLADKRSIRVFISSTFRDMHAERDYLVKFVFPQLRRFCEARGVTWGEVDLRWGVTDEEVAEGKVLPICLEEINRCRPYFIGLLGERYGWVPQSLPAELVENEEWLREQFAERKSVTELEILHGVLRNPAMAGHAFFYFRNPAYLATIPESERLNFTTEDTESIEKLKKLKDQIRGCGLPVRENYSTSEALGKLILADLTVVINRIFPEGSQPDLLTREEMDHETYAQSRERVYIGRPESFAQLDAHADGSGDQPLVILGESGSGKSALLANWAVCYQRTHPDAFVLEHYIGATPGSADWAAILRRIMGEFKRKLGLQQEIPDKSDALRSAFPNWLHMASQRLSGLEDRNSSWWRQFLGMGQKKKEFEYKRIILILDALNQIEDRDGAQELFWLPLVMPENVRIVVSTLPGKSLDEIKKRGWPVMKVEPLSMDERKELIRQFLDKYGRQLSLNRIERIASAPQSANPLYLSVLLDELRLFGMHERLGDQIELYLKTSNIPALYELILERYEQDYERERPELVRDSMSLLWAARRGLSEAELMELLGADGQPLPHAYWSPLHLAMEQSLLSCVGFIGFNHDYLRQAVQNRYLREQLMQKSAHLHLADYFEAQSGGSSRYLDELPWQFAQAKEWQRLYALLGDLVFFKAAWVLNDFEVKTYWTQVEANTPYRMLDAYRKVIDHPGQHQDQDQDHVWFISSLMYCTGHLVEALTLRTYLVKYYRKAGDKFNLERSLGSQANILYSCGDLDGAMALHKEKERICRDLGDKDGLQRTLGNQALIMADRGDLNRALALHKQAERICRQLGDKYGLGLSLGNQANILYSRGDLDGAMALHKEEERIYRELGDKDGLQRTLGNQSLILKVHGDMVRAMALNKEEECICREMENKDGLQIALGRQAVILYDRGDLDGAMVLYKEVECICRELGNKKRLGSTLGNQALILSARGDLDGAMALHKEEERICRELGDKAGLGCSLGNQGCILVVRGDMDRSMALYKEQERICREIGDKALLQNSICNQANILYSRGELDRAMALHKEEEFICRELGYKAGLGCSLGNQGLILSARGDQDGAMKLHKEQERICRELGDKVGLQSSLTNQGIILYKRGELDRAMALYKEQERICCELGYKDMLGLSLGNQALILSDRGNLDGAMALHKEEERIYHELGNKAGLGLSLGNQALILSDRGDLDGAMALHKEEEHLYREVGDKAGLGQSLNSQANILSDRGDKNRAMALYKEKERICRDLGDKAGLGLSLGNQALILVDRGDLDGAMALHKEEERLYREVGDKDGLQLSLGNQALILVDCGDLDVAIALQKEQERICHDLGNPRSMAISLKNHAIILAKMGKNGKAHRLAEESLRLAQEHGYRSLAQQIKSIKDKL